MALTKVTRDLLNTGIDDNSTSTAITITSGNNVGINQTSPAFAFCVSDDSNPNRNGMEIAIGTSDTASNTIQNYNRATSAYTPLNIASSVLTFGVGASATERLRIGSAGQIGLSGANYGTSGQVLTSNGGSSAPTWQDASGGGNIDGTTINPSAVQIGGTTVIDANRQIYAKGGTQVGEDGTYAGYGVIGFSGITNGHNRVFGRDDTGDGLYLAAATNTGVIIRTNGGSSDTFSFTSAGAFQVGGTTVIDSSRNLLNMGTGAFSGNVKTVYTGNSDNDSGIYVNNDASDWGIKITKVNSDNYGMLIESSGTYAFAIRDSANAYKVRFTGTGDGIFGGTVTAQGLYVNNSNTLIHEGDGNAPRLQTDSGYVDIGPMNTSWCHFQTDRAKFYFEKQITVDSGIVSSYNENLVLRRAENSNHQLSIGQGVVTTSSYIYAQRLYASSDGTVGYFFNDSGTRTAYAGGDFYIQNSVGNYYNYATSQYMGATSGDTIYLRGNRMTHNGWDFQADGHIRMYDSTQIRFGTGGDCEFFCNGSHMYIDLNSGIGNLYIRDGSTTRYTFNDNGNFTATGNVTAYSDRRVKDQFEPITNALAKVQRLHGQTYIRTDMDDDDRRYAGLIAQDVEAVLPEAVTEIEDHLALDYSGTIALLVEAIKELKQEVNDLKAQLEDK